MYDFDEMIRRNGLSTMKWEAEIQRTGYEDLLCFGTADMDFSSPEPVLQAVRQIADAGHLGYPYPPEAYYDSILSLIHISSTGASSRSGSRR